MRDKRETWSKEECQELKLKETDSGEDMNWGYTERQRFLPILHSRFQLNVDSDEFIFLAPSQTEEKQQNRSTQGRQSIFNTIPLCRNEDLLELWCMTVVAHVFLKRPN